MEYFWSDLNSDLALEFLLHPFPLVLQLEFQLFHPVFQVLVTLEPHFAVLACSLR